MTLCHQMFSSLSYFLYQQIGIISNKYNFFIFFCKMLEEVHFVTIRYKNMVHLTHTRYFTFYIQTPSTRQWYFVQSQSISRNATIATSVYLVSTDLVIHRQWQNVVSQINKKNKKLNKKKHLFPELLQLCSSVVKQPLQ